MPYPTLCAVRPLEGHRLLLTYANGETREYDFTPNLGHKYFAPLADAALFQAVTVTEGELEWETGQDFCPHTLYDASKPKE